MTGFVRVGNAADLQDGKMKMVTVGTEQVCLANVEGKYYAIGNICTHAHCPLARGSLEEYLVTCPCHGSQFDVRTGEVKRPPARTPEPVYEVKLEDGNIMVKPHQEGSKVSLPLG